MVIKDWTKNIEGLPDMDVPALENLYSEMLATAHELGYEVPDKLLVETQDATKLREVIPPLHEGIKKFHAGLDKPREGKGAAGKQKANPKKTAAEPTAKKTKSKPPKKPATPAPQKEDVSESTNMATATAKKASAKKAPAKKAAAKKAGGKGATANARTPVARSKYQPDQTITVKLKENPARKGTPVFDRVANLIKHNGKTVGAFLKTDLGRSSTLNNGVERGWITIK